MNAWTISIVAIVALVALAAAVLTAMVWMKPDAPEPPAAILPTNAVALPPARKPTVHEKNLARLINGIDADMRSIELGRWFLRRMKDQVREMDEDAPCKSALDEIDFRDIVRDVPGINPVAEREAIGNMRRLVAGMVQACEDGASARWSLVNAIDELRASALDTDGGILRGMPGYAESSRLPLPYPDDD